MLIVFSGKVFTVLGEKHITYGDVTDMVDAHFDEFEDDILLARELVPVELNGALIPAVEWY